MPEKGRAYPPEFRGNAVQLYRTSDISIRELASDLGIAGETLRKWIKQVAIDSGRAEVLTAEEREELGELRRKVERLTMEREILKKAAAFFANENGIR
jgi:transposase-like protein